MALKSPTVQTPSGFGFNSFSYTYTTGAQHILFKSCTAEDFTVLKCYHFYTKSFVIIVLVFAVLTSLYVASHIN